MVAESQVKHVCFRMHGQDFALDIAAVRETLALRPITRVFLTPPHFAGIINLRGDVVPVLDVAQLLGLPPIVTTQDTRVVLCQYRAAGAGADGGAPRGEPRREPVLAGILVDELTELRTLDLGRLEPPPPTLPRETAALLAGVVMLDGHTPLQVLDIARLFTSDQVRVFQREAS
ncbi:MAG TPA: chemotaxis protein CheW [Haliangium sp.]|nr:chemotaxis protein CheW [Haliangium sp.]